MSIDRERRRTAKRWTVAVAGVIVGALVTGHAVSPWYVFAYLALVALGIALAERWVS